METGWIGINLVAIVLSIIVAWGVLKIIDRTPSVPEPMMPPPPPPTFGNEPPPPPTFGHEQDNAQRPDDNSPI